jgi:competence protein ComEA
MKIGFFLDKYRFYIAGVLVMIIIAGWVYLFFSTMSESSTDTYNQEIEVLKSQIAELKNQVENISLQEVSSEETKEEKNIPDIININTASSEELQSLSGIGAVRAQDIITYRENHGGFASISEIQNVKGIGPATFAKISDKISIE